jgi:hypothetical protein
LFVGSEFLGVFALLDAEFVGGDAVSLLDLSAVLVEFFLRFRRRRVRGLRLGDCFAFAASFGLF